MDEVEGSWASSLTGARAVDGSGAESPSFGDGKFRYCRQFPDELEDVTSLSPSHCAPEGAIYATKGVASAKACKR